MISLSFLAPNSQHSPSPKGNGPSPGGSLLFTLKLLLNLFAFGAREMFVLAAAGWPSKVAHAETMAGFPGEQPRQLITSTQLAAAPTLCKQGSPADSPVWQRAPRL